MGISIGHIISRASTNKEMMFSMVDSLASAMSAAPASTSRIKRGCISDKPTPTANNLTGPNLSKRVKIFGGGASGSSSPKKLRTPRMSNSKPKIKKTTAGIVLFPPKLVEEICPCPGYLGHPFGKQGSLRRSDVVGRRSERESHDRNACFGTDNPSSQDNHASVRFCAPFLALVFAVGFISSSEVEWLFHICRRQGFYPYSGSPRLVGLMREKHREQQDLQHPVEA